jgi:hypothetical protein
VQSIENCSQSIENCSQSIENCSQSIENCSQSIENCSQSIEIYQKITECSVAYLTLPEKLIFFTPLSFQASATVLFS